MDENKLEAKTAAGEPSVPFLAAQAPFSPSRREKTAAFLMYFAAYIYYCEGLSGWGLLAFTAAFIALTEFINWERPRSAESLIWLGCVVTIALCIFFGRAQVWGELYPYLFLHIFAVWWALSRSGRLLEGESGPLLPLDALNGFIVFPFKHFFLRIRCVWYTLGQLRRGRSGAKRENILWTALALAAAGALFILAAGLLIAADDSFARLFSKLTEFFRRRLDIRWSFDLLLSLPIGAYLFGLIAGSAREDEAALRKRGEAVRQATAGLRKVANPVWTGLTGLFCLLYLLFFIVQAGYLFGAFTRSLPEGFIVSQYARQGFFELCKVMAVNFLLLWLVTGTAQKPVGEDAPARLLCAILLAESILFAVVAFSKLALYISCFGFTPLRLQSSWLVCVLLAGCICALYSLFSGKRSFRGWMIFGALSLSLLHLY